MQSRLAAILLLSLATMNGTALAVDVGVAQVDISPDGPIRLHGYLGRSGPSKGIDQPIRAKAIAIGSDAQGPVLLLSADLLGVTDDLVADLSARLQKKVGLPRERLTVSASHTHSAPCITGLAPNIFGRKYTDLEQSTIDRYTVGLADKLEKVCLDALAARSPATLGWSQGSVDFAENRRTKGGPVDHSVPVLVARGTDGKPRAVLVNYACHCTTMDPSENTIHADWAGVAQAAIERDHPGVVALTIVGCGADANPKLRGTPGKAVVNAHGEKLGKEVARLIAGPLKPLEGPPAATLKSFRLPFDTLPTREQYLETIKAGGAPGYNASNYLKQLEAGTPPIDSIPYSVQTWAFDDDLLMVFLPGEVVVDYVLRLKKELDPARLWVVAYTNDDPCYIPSERILREGGYEAIGAMAYYGWPTRLKPGVEDAIIAQVLAISPPKFHAKAQAPVKGTAPKTPDQSRRSIKLPPGLKAELVAAEPLVTSPVAIDWGGDGSLWVCEMYDYPTGLDRKFKPGGRVKRLRDADGDGRYDTATTLLDDLPFPTGIMAWRKGVLICAAPEILYAEDTDGDGKADIRRVLFEGFNSENYQARINGLHLGLDGLVHAANGLLGGSIRSTLTGQVVDLGGRDLRFDPDRGTVEPVSGLSQQGRVRDDWGNAFGCSNSALANHFPFPDDAARRNPRVATPDPSVYVPRSEDPNKLYPASTPQERFNHPESLNYATSACGICIYRGDSLGPEYQNNLFVCEPVHNLVHRETLTDDGVTFAGQRALTPDNQEFFASTDPWSRPVQARTGPDGALYVVDMYRHVIEHPRWISPDQLATLDVRAGADLGRIYRVTRQADASRHAPASLETLDTPALAAALDDSSGTRRDTVHRLLLHRADTLAVPTLARLAANSPRPSVRLQALGILDTLGSLPDTLLIASFKDFDARVRRHAVLLSGRRVAGRSIILEGLLALESDPALIVRYQLALSLGASNDPHSAAALARIALRDPEDEWIRGAVLSSAFRLPAEVLSAVLGAAGQGTPDSRLVSPLVATLAAAPATPGTAKALAGLFPLLAKLDPEHPQTWRLSALAELAESRHLDLSPLLPTFGVARQIVGRESIPDDDRALAVRLLGREPRKLPADLALVSSFLTAEAPPALRSAAIARLARIDDPDAGARLLAAWPALPPADRGDLLDALLARPGSTSLLLDALAKNLIPAGSIDAGRRKQLVDHPDDAIRARAQTLPGLGRDTARAELVAARLEEGSGAGSVEKGAVVFGRLCSTCHKLGGVGHEVGPDLAALTDLSPQGLLAAIFDPNRDVDARYVEASAALSDGRVLSGILASETANAVTLKSAGGRLDVLLRADIEALKFGGKSLMPEGLERDLKPGELADLVAYLRGQGAAPRSFPGNTPRTVAQQADGSIRLVASAASIYGDTLAFEPEHANLGFWSSPSDRASWSLDVAREGTYTLSIEWACPDESAGNRYLIRIPGREFSSVVGPTAPGSWDRYRTAFVAEVHLDAGRQTLDIRADGPINNAVFDLKTVLLTPRNDGAQPASKD
ncbi:c-type cytochrome [Isosphaeraceae bacterium EP7]